MNKTIAIIAILPCLYLPALGQLPDTSPRPIGSLSLGGIFVGSGRTACQSGFECRYVNITSNVPEGPGQRRHVLAIKRTTNPNVKGTVVFFSGHAGQLWYNTSTYSRDMFQRLLNDGWDIVQAKMLGKGWPDPAGYRTGFVGLASRPATMIAWVHDNWQRGPKLIVAGCSEGSHAIGLSLAIYGRQNGRWLFQDVDGAILMSGPPFADGVNSCTNPDNTGFHNPSETSLWDQPFAWSECDLHNDTSYNRTAWRDSSTASARDNDGHVGVYLWTGTRVWSLMGASDGPEIFYPRNVMVNTLRSAGQSVDARTIPNTGHNMQSSPTAMGVLGDIITSQ